MKIKIIKAIEYKVAHIRLCYSRYFLMIAYPHEQLEMVLDAHDQAFLFFGGSCRKGIYDNMKTAVKTILQGKDREYNPRFLQMSCHHLFEPVACTPGSGWEKGQVENQVGTGRGNFFTPLVKVTSFEELNVRLEAFCVVWSQKMFHPQYKTRKVFDVYEEERTSLIPYRGKFNSCKILCEVVSPYSLVLYDTNRYSVEVSYVGQPVDMLVYAWDMVNIRAKPLLVINVLLSNTVMSIILGIMFLYWNASPVPCVMVHPLKIWSFLLPYKLCVKDSVLILTERVGLSDFYFKQINTD